MSGMRVIEGGNKFGRITPRQAPVPETYLDRVQMARIMGISPKTLDRWRKEYGIPSVIWGARSRRYLASEVIAHMQDVRLHREDAA